MIVQLINEYMRKRYPNWREYYTDTDLFNLLAYVFRSGKTLEDRLRDNPFFLGDYCDCEPKPCPDFECTAENVYEYMTVVNHSFARESRPIAMHRAIVFSPADLILPQDLDSLGIDVIRFYAQRGYIATYAVHADSYNPHIQIVVNSTGVDGRPFRVPCEWNILHAIAHKWESRHNDILLEDEGYYQFRESALYGTPQYGKIAVFGKDMVRNNKISAKKRKQYRLQ